MRQRGITASSQLSTSPRPPAFRYGIVLLSTALATSLWLVFDQQLVPMPFLLFTGAMALSAWWSGLGPALTAIGLSTLACLLLFSLPEVTQVWWTP